MSEADDAQGPPVPAGVIPRLTEVAAKLAAGHEDPRPKSVTAVATTRAKALHVVFGYGPNPGGDDIPVYVVAMTGWFASYRSGLSRDPLPRTGPYLTVIIDAQTLESSDVTMGDTGPRAPLSRLGPVTRLTW
jgi:hypothetical protein